MVICSTRSASRRKIHGINLAHDVGEDHSLTGRSGVHAVGFEEAVVGEGPGDAVQVDAGGRDLADDVGYLGDGTGVPAENVAGEECVDARLVDRGARTDLRPSANQEREAEILHGRRTELDFAAQLRDGVRSLQVRVSKAVRQARSVDSRLPHPRRAEVARPSQNFLHRWKT